MKIAVVGAGVSGLATTWLLNEHSDHEVHLFDSEDRAGGHADTVAFARPGVKGARPVDVDRGFIVFNESTYPNFSRFLQLAKIPCLPTNMTLSVSRDYGAFEWASKSPFTVFCQPWNVVSPKMWLMVYDISRFNNRATADIAVPPGSLKDEIGSKSLRDYVRFRGYSQAFVDNYLLPMTASIWSTPNVCALDFPARSQLQFMHNHHLLQMLGGPPWYTIAGGSKLYVRRIISKLPADQLHLGTPIYSVSTGSNSRVVVKTAAGAEHEFDHVVMACHSDTSIRLLQTGASGVTELERKILSAVWWAANEVVLHNDLDLMPIRKAAWSCWNFLTFSRHDPDGGLRSNAEQVSVTFDMNQLQHLPESEHGKVLITLNPLVEPRPETIVSQRIFSHPVFTSETPWAQENLPRIQNVRGITFAGAWTRHGFHEDGFRSGMVVACQYLGARPPFPILEPHRENDVTARGGGINPWNWLTSTWKQNTGILEL